jgi:AraC family transcriptional regulator
MHVMTTVTYSGHPHAEESGAWATSLVRLLNIALKEIDADRSAAKAVIAKASSLLRTQIDLSSAGPPQSSVSGALTGWQVRRILTFLENHVDQPVRVEDLRRLVNLSPCHFSRSFKRSFGEPPQTYLMRRKLDYARQLMLVSDMSLSEVAQASGFSDQAHFSRKFRQQVGQSPAVWRREHGTDRNNQCQAVHP